MSSSGSRGRATPRRPGNTVLGSPAFLQNLGPAVYNQAIQDARKYMAERLDDLDATFFQEEPAGKPAPR